MQVTQNGIFRAFSLSFDFVKHPIFYVKKGGITILPLDTPNGKVIELLQRTNPQLDVDTFDVALLLDLNVYGDFGEVWLLLDIKNKRLYRVRLSDENVTEFDTSTLKSAYIDSYTTSNRFLALETSDDVKTKTIVIGSCTNAVKCKLLAFKTIWERLSSGIAVKDDDPIFEQFNAKCPKCGRVYENQHRRICKHCINKKGTIVRMLSYFKDFKPQLLLVLLCMVISSAISLLNPIISGQLLFDQVISKPSYNDAGEQITGKFHELRYVYIVVGIILGMAMLSLAIGILQNRCNAYMSTRVTKNMKNDIFRAMNRLSLSYFNQNPTGRLISRVNYDAVRIRNFYIDGVPHFIVHMMNFIGLTVFLFSINWKLTLIVFIPVPIIIAIFRVMLPRLWRMYNKQWRHSSSLNAFLGDSLNGVRVVKAFAKEAEEANRFYEYSTSLYNANLKVNIVSLTIFPVVSLLIGISSQAIWGFGGVEVMSTRMTYGELTTYLGYIGMIFGPLNFFSTFTNLMTDTMNSAVRMFETLDMIPEIADAPDAVRMDKIEGAIKFNHVCFHYSPNRPILKDVSFELKPGDHLGLVGHTGSGKSTIANLITRMYDTVSGSVKIDGVNVKKIKTECLRKNIAIVSQEIFLFRGTIAENIRYARPDATLEEVVAAAKAANAHEFILNLPEGYETMVGIGSRSLSGGERQRVSIARALLLAPQLLILDEATAAMDTETERLISEAIDKLIVGRTTITIAHRLSTLKNCNLIMAIEHGEVAEMGTQEELLEKKGVYYKLYTLQNEQMKKVMEGA